MTPYDLSKSDPTSVRWGGEIQTDEQQEAEEPEETTEPLKDTEGRLISKNEEYFIAYLEPKNGTKSTHGCLNIVDERYVHAEDIASFCFDSEYRGSVTKCEPVLGKDLIE